MFVLGSNISSDIRILLSINFQRATVCIIVILVDMLKMYSCTHHLFRGRLFPFLLLNRGKRQSSLKHSLLFHKVGHITLACMKIGPGTIPADSYIK